MGLSFAQVQEASAAADAGPRAALYRMEFAPRVAAAGGATLP